MEPLGGQNEPTAPTAEMIQEILAVAGPDLDRLFQLHGVTAEEAEALLSEALDLLVMRWGRISDPVLWIIGVVDTMIRRRLLITLFQEAEVG